MNQELFKRGVNKRKRPLNLYVSIKVKASMYYYSFIFIIIKLKKFINDEKFYWINNNLRMLKVIKVE